MNRKSILFALILLLLSANGAAARPPAQHAAVSTAVSAAAAPPAYAQGGCFVAGLNGGNETLAARRQNETQQVVTPATGIGAFVLSPIDPLTTTRKLTYSIAFTGTLGPETIAHIHKGAPGVAGPPIITLPAGNLKEGPPLSLDAQAVADLLAGLLYVNIHTDPNPDGEIRGQILPGGGCFSTIMSGASETPESFGPGKGTGTFLLLPPDPITSTRKLIYDVEFANLLGPETMAHIHKGAAGVAGPVIEPLPLGSPKRGVLNIQAQTAEDLLAGLLYVNIHSLVLQNGEIRGQILPFGGSCYTAIINGSTETPPNTSTATGQGTFFLSPSTLTTTLKLAYAISYSTTLTPTMAHIHKGAQGIAIPGNIVFPLSTSNPITGTLTLSRQQAADLLSGLYYVNIHSAKLTQGEIRGQIVQSACKTVFVASSLR
jgi:trimeric autotransporter adhesin